LTNNFGESEMSLFFFFCSNFFFACFILQIWDLTEEALVLIETWQCDITALAVVPDTPYM